MGRDTSTDGLCILCTGLGIAEEDEDGNVKGYTKTDYCLDNLKDLQRFLRRDDGREVFKQICRWNTVSRDLVPIIEHYQSDRVLVINVAKILVFLTMPIDPTSEEVALQVEYLWDLKAALNRNVTMAVIVSLLEEPLAHLESNEFTEDDWKLVQLMLTLFRNILAIQDVTPQQKASGSATHLFSLTERILELMFQENIMDLILVFTQHVDDSNGYLRHENLLLLEIFHYILLGQDPELVAKPLTDSKVNADSSSADYLRLMIEAEDEKKRARQSNLECHPLFSGAFTRIAFDGSKKLFKDPVSASANGLAKCRKVQRGPLKKVASDNGVLSIHKHIHELLHIFLKQLLAGGYNDLMQTVRDDIINEQRGIQNSDVITFFQVTHFITSFHQKRILSMGQNTDNMVHVSSVNSSAEYFSSHEGLCGPLAATMNEAMYFLIISKWREAADGVKSTNNYKFLTAAGSLMKSMVRMLDLVLKLHPENSKECQTARVLLYKLFYDQTEEGLTQFLLNRFKGFDFQKQPRSDLADLLETIHIMLRLMEKLQANGTLRVSKKSRRRRVRNNGQMDNIEIESKLAKGPEVTLEKVESGSEMCIDTGELAKEELPKLNFVVNEQEFNYFGSPNLSPAVSLDKSLQNKEHFHDHSSAVKVDKENVKHAEEEYESSSSSNAEEPLKNEVNFNISTLVSSFASSIVIHNLCWLLKHYKVNSSSTNHYILCMLNRFCHDLELSPMLYQLSILIIFYDVLAEQKRSNSREHSNIVHFLTNFLRKMFKMMKKKPLLFVEILFWKSRRDCQYLNAEILIENIQILKKDVKNMVGDSTGEVSGHRDLGYRSIADALGEDEIDLDLPQIKLNQRVESDEGDSIRNKKSKFKKSVASTLENYFFKDSSEIPPLSPRAPGFLKRDTNSDLTKEQHAIINELYEKHKDDRQQCSLLIAEALDPAGKISPAFISRTLKQLGLNVVPKKKLVKANALLPDDIILTVSGSAVNATIQNGLNNSENTPFLKRKRKQELSFSDEEEHQIKILFEKFKSHKKRNVMIANSMKPEMKFTAAQVSRKLKELGLLPPGKKSARSGKQMEGNDFNEIKENSDEEKLIAFRKRSNRKKRMGGMNASPSSASRLPKSTSQESYSDDVVLSSFIDTAARREMNLSKEDQETMYSDARVVDNPSVENDSREGDLTSQEVPELHESVKLESHVELEDLLDSEDDAAPAAPRNTGSRKRVLLDLEEDD